VIVHAPRIFRSLGWMILCAFAALGVCVPAAHAASVTLGVSVSPPRAVVNDGAHSQYWSATLDFLDTDPDRYTVAVRQQQGSDPTTGCFNGPLAPWFTPQSYDISGAKAPYQINSSFVVPKNTTPGRYCVVITYFRKGQALFAARAASVFDITQSVGTLRLTKFEDLNGDGIRQPNEPGIGSWPFSVEAPTGNGIGTDTTIQRTAGDGSLVVTDAITGTYRVAEILPNPNPQGWVPTTAPEQTFTLTSGQVREVVIGNARPRQLCGTVYVDTNRDGRYQQGEPPKAGVVVALSGSDGLGNQVPDDTTATTGKDGRYCFGPLMPGTYTVAEQVPSGYVASWDKDGAGNGDDLITPITLVSGVPSMDNDFGLLARENVTRLCVSKRANRRKVRQGGTVAWTIRVRNCGRHTARKVVISDPLLADTTLMSRKGASLVRGELLWRVGTLRRGKSKTVRFSVRFDRDARVGRHRNTATADSASSRPKRATATVQVLRKLRPPKPIAVTG